MKKIGIMLRRHADILRIIFLIMIGYLLLHDLAEEPCSFMNRSIAIRCRRSHGVKERYA